MRLAATLSRTKKFRELFNGIGKRNFEINYKRILAPYPESYRLFFAFRHLQPSPVTFPISLQV